MSVRISSTSAHDQAGVSRDRRGIARLMAWLASQTRLAPRGDLGGRPGAAHSLVVVEATDGLEQRLTAALVQAAITVAAVNPCQIHDRAGRRPAGTLSAIIIRDRQPSHSSGPCVCLPPLPDTFSVV